MIKLFKNINKKELLLILISIVLIIIQVQLELKIPEYMSKITVLVQTEGSKTDDILLNGLYMIICAFLTLIAGAITGFLIANVSSTFSMRLRKTVFTKVSNLSMKEIKEFSTGSLITRTTNDITQLEMLFAMGLQALIKAPITAVWAIIKIVNNNLQWSGIIGLAVLIMLFTLACLTIMVMPKFKIIQNLIDKINGITRENLNGIRVVRAFNAEKYQENKFEKVNNDLTNNHLFVQKSFAIMQPIMILIMCLVTLGIYFIGAFLIQEAVLIDKLNLFGNMVVFSSYAMQVIMAFLMIAMIFIMLPRAQVSSKRINEILDTEINIKEGNISTDKAKVKGTIEFKDVYFKYPDADEYLLEKISFKVNSGETVAFIGSTGSGKSTIINLMLRFYDATKGEILIDGLNIKKYTEDFLFSKLGYVSQKPVIFNETINYNISYGNKYVSEDKIKEAAKIAQAEEFIKNIDNTYDAKIAQGGTNLSGGQKQRLSIARAIAKNPEIYLFDDSFSALDYKTDVILRKELRRHTKNATNIIVAQRIGTIINADKIVVLDNGKCVGIGTHKELLEKCEVYKQIALSQLSKEELENV